MREIKVNYTILDIVEVPDTATVEEIQQALLDNFNDIIMFRTEPDDMEFTVPQEV